MTSYTNPERGKECLNLWARESEAPAHTVEKRNTVLTVCCSWNVLKQFVLQSYRKIESETQGEIAADTLSFFRYDGNQYFIQNIWTTEVFGDKYAT